MEHLVDKAGNRDHVENRHHLRILGQEVLTRDMRETYRYLNTPGVDHSSFASPQPTQANYCDL